MRSNYSNW